jgi:hypothetical protein
MRTKPITRGRFSKQIAAPSVSVNAVEIPGTPARGRQSPRRTEQPLESSEAPPHEEIDTTEHQDDIPVKRFLLKTKMEIESRQHEVEGLIETSNAMLSQILLAQRHRKTLPVRFASLDRAETSPPQAKALYADL